METPWRRQIGRTGKSLLGFANDIRKVNETLTSQLYILDIKDNPNISIDVTSVCSQIRAGRYKLIYDKTQDIRGCDALDPGNVCDDGGILFVRFT